MEQSYTTLDLLKLSPRPGLDVDFFADFPERLLAKVEDSAPSFDGPIKSNRPKVPAGFFDSFADTLLSKINSPVDSESERHTGTLLDSLSISRKPNVPDEFFTSAYNLEIHPIRKSRVISMTRWMSGCAAAILLLFFLVYKPSSDLPVQTNASASSARSEAEQEEFLTYLDEDEITEYIIENDVDFSEYGDNETQNTLYDFAGDEIEEYYFD